MNNYIKMTANLTLLKELEKNDKLIKDKSEALEKCHFKYDKFIEL